MVINKITGFFRQLRYGGMLDIIDLQNKKINKSIQTSVSLYNKIFSLSYIKRTNVETYHGPLQDLRDCKVFKTDKSNAKWKKSMIEVIEVNGYNSAIYYWYFDKSAKLICDDIDKATVDEELIGTPYVPKSSVEKKTASKSVKPKNSK